jgi:hypothetical protein
MGVVYRARQLGLNRPVALKMHLGADPRQVIRFLAEAEAVAAVKHPHVVEVYKYGEHDGRPFLVMEFCPGGSLDRSLGAGRLEPRAAADLLAKVAAGVGAAHEQGIVHRDLKPANVLLDAAGEPKVTDFGLAKRAGGAGQTQTGAVMGTPAYMSPEQAGGGTKFVGPPTDVWSLGVVLYEMLAGDRPFAGQDSWSTLGQVMKGEVPPLGRKVTGLPRDLVLICERCLCKDPRDRYPTAGELAADLQRFLAGEPVSVRAPGPAERLWRWARRNPVVAGLLAAVVLMTVGGLAGLSSLWLDAAAARRLADRRAGDAEAARAEAQAERDRAVGNLREAVRQRERAHFYLETFLDMRRFGRTLTRHPMRDDFALGVVIMNRGSGERSRAQIAVGDFDKSQPFQLAITSPVDCHVTVFYALPESSRKPGRPAACLLVYPNALERGERLAAGRTYLIPGDPRAFLSPVVTEGEPAYLYIVASERAWVPEPDLPSVPFPGFSPEGMARLATAVTALVEGPGPAAGSPRVAEEIVVFNVRSNAMPGGPANHEGKSH